MSCALLRKRFGHQTPCHAAPARDFLRGVTSVMATKQGSRKPPVFVRQLDRATRRHVFLVAAIRLAAFLALIVFLLRHCPIGGFNEDNPAAAWIRLLGILLVF